MSANESTTSIDDLLRHDTDEDLPPEPAPRRSPLGLLRTVVVAAVLTGVLVYGLRLVGVQVQAVPVFAAFVALLVLRRWVRQVAAPPPPTRSAARAAGADEGRYNWAGHHDALRTAVRRWEARLDAVDSDPARFSRTVLPVLADLTDERLRQRHGVSRTTDPQRARELLGEPLWRLLTEPGRPPRRRELATHVETLENL